MKRIFYLILIVVILCCGCGYAGGNLEIHKLGEMDEWVSSDGVHYWISGYKMAPRYDNNGNLVIDELEEY